MNKRYYKAGSAVLGVCLFIALGAFIGKVVFGTTKPHAVSIICFLEGQEVIATEKVDDYSISGGVTWFSSDGKEVTYTGECLVLEDFNGY